MWSSLLQIVGLSAITTGAILEFGVAGGLAGAGIMSVYVGLAMERD